jgi:hypothetical protein
VVSRLELFDSVRQAAKILAGALFESFECEIGRFTNLTTKTVNLADEITNGSTMPMRKSDCDIAKDGGHDDCGSGDRCGQYHGVLNYARDRDAENCSQNE